MPCMTKFDESQLKLRRAFSLEDIKEEEYSSDDEDDLIDIGQKKKGHIEDVVDIEKRLGNRRYSFPLSPRSMMDIEQAPFEQKIQEIKKAQKDKYVDNCYTEVKAPNKEKG